MKKTIKSTYLSLCLAILTFNSFLTVVKAAPSDTNSEIDQFKGKIQSTPDSCWKKPADNRRNAIINKLSALQELVWDENFAEAYDKLLRDIKPKLTGLKTDEKEESWGSGVFKEAWVTCSELREEFRMECNRLLSYLKAGSIHDDDSTPPTISINYHGGYNQEDPGFWDVAVEDLESGIDEVQILIDGDVYIHDQDLSGVQTLFYQDIPVYVGPEPVVPLGIHSIDVIAVNNDKDWEGDQESDSDQNWVDIIPAPDDDVEPPVIVLTPASMEITDAETVGGILVEWQITDASGIAQATVLLNGEPIASYGTCDSVSDSYLLSNIPGTYTIDITARDDDNDPWHQDGVDWLESTAQTTITVIDDDTKAPDIIITYEGDATEDNPGVWNVYVEDIGSGLAEVKISIDGTVMIHDQQLGGITSKSYIMPVPRFVGVHIIEVFAKDNDNNWDGDQQEMMTTELVDITPPIFG